MATGAAFSGSCYLSAIIYKSRYPFFFAIVSLLFSAIAYLLTITFWKALARINNRQV